MIAKPFFDRFKSADQNKQQEKQNASSPSVDEKLLLKLLNFSLKLENSDETLLKISRTLCFNLDVDSICIYEVKNQQIKLRQLFHDGENVPIIDESWHINNANLDIIEKQRVQYYDNINEACPDNQLLGKLNSKSLFSIPSMNEKGEITTIINVLHRKARKYSYCETEILKQMAQRAALYFQFKKQQLPQPAAANDSDLEIQLKQVTNQLNISNKSLESLSYAVSHELRAPLRTMDNFSKILFEDFSSSLPEEATDYVTRIRKACTRMSHMIDDLLWLTRVSRRNLEKQNIDLSKLFKKIAQELLAEEPDRKVELKTQSNLSVFADKGLLRIAIQHLLTNAIKFTRQQENAIIELSSEKQGDNLVYAIHDNGKGFDMAHYDQLFEPFKQLHSSNKFDGTGLGLATVGRVIERHKGKIWAESDIDEGATFYFSLPVE